MRNNNTTAMDVNNSSVLASQFNDARSIISHDTLNEYAQEIAQTFNDVDEAYGKHTFYFDEIEVEVSYYATLHESWGGSDDYGRRERFAWYEIDSISVDSVIDEDGDRPDIARYLQSQLN